MSRRWRHNLYVDWAEQSRAEVMTDVWDDGIVHADWAEHRLVMIGLGEDLIVNVDWAEHGLILIDLGENFQVHVDTT